MKRKEGNFMKKQANSSRAEEEKEMYRREAINCVEEHQRKRICMHPLRVKKENMIVLDELETNRFLLILKPDTEEPVYLQRTYQGVHAIGATAVGEMIVSFPEEEDAVLIHKFFCTEGEELAEAMIEQVQHMARYYQFGKIRMLDSAYQK